MKIYHRTYISISKLYWNLLIFHILKKLSFGDDCPLLKIFLCPRFFLTKQKTFEVGISKKNELKFPLTDFLKRSFYHLYTTTKPFFPVQPTRIYSKHLRNRPFIPIKSFLSDVTFVLEGEYFYTSVVIKDFHCPSSICLSIW